MLTLDEKLYQLFISRLDGPKLSTNAYRSRALELVRRGIGGFIVMGGVMDEVRSFVIELQAASAVPLFIASDVERGVGQQITGATVFPSQMAVAAAVGGGDAHTESLVLKALAAVAGEAAYAGINMPLIPVMDVNTNPDNPIICTRAFSDDPDVAARLGASYIRAIEGAGLISCAKHFPGHGSTSADSHISLPVITKPVSELTGTDLPPFTAAVEAGVGSIMIGHLRVEALDTVPATVSGKIITGLLRERLGYEGLVITDALSMDALKGVKDIYAEALNAGADILLHPEDADSAVAELKEAVKGGSVTAGRVDRALERILERKSGLNVSLAPAPDFASNKKISEELADSSITLVKGTPADAFVKGTENLTVVVSGEKKYYDTSPLRELAPGASRYLYLEESGKVEDYAGAAEDGTLIVAIYTSVAAWKGSSGIGERESGLIKGLMKRAGRSIVISFGSPYVLSHFPGAGVLIAAYDATEGAGRSVIRHLAGESDFAGSLPVRLAPF